LARCSAQRCQCSRLGFHSLANLDQVQQRLNRLFGQAIAVRNPVWLCFADESAAALAGFEQAIAFQNRDRFTENGPADAEVFGHRQFRWQPRSRGQVITLNLFEQHFSDARSKGAGLERGGLWGRT